MARPNKSGAPGLSKVTRYVDEHGAKVSEARADEIRRAGGKVREVTRYVLNLRVRRIGADGRMEEIRHQEVMADGTTASAAKDHATKTRNAMKDGTYTPGQLREEKTATKGSTVHEMLDAVITWARVNKPKSLRTRSSLVAMIKANLDDRPLDALDPAAVEAYKATRTTGEGKVGPATVNREVAALKHACGLAAKGALDGLALDPLRAAAVRAVGMLTEPPGRVRYLAPDEEQRLYSKLDGTIRQIATVANMTGMRRAEVARLLKSAVDLENRQINLTVTKANKTRPVPISPALLPILRAQIDATPKGNPWVFPAARGKGQPTDTSKPYTLDAVSRAFKRAAVAAKVVDFKFHDLRHDAATKVRRGGAGLDVVGKLLGHSAKSIRTTMRYAHVGDDMVAAAVVAIPAPTSRPPAKS